MTAEEQARNLDAAAAGLRALADALEAGHGPRRNRGPRRVGGASVVPAVVHDAICGIRVATPQPDTTSPIMGCAGCGLAYTVEDALTLRDPRTARRRDHGPARSAADGDRS